jgi:outer membrane protein assembly factor BamB
MRRSILFLVTSFLLVDCGGGGGSAVPAAIVGAAAVPVAVAPTPQPLWNSWRGPHFTGVADTTISSSTVGTLSRTWSTPTNDTVYATPAMTNDRVIVGGKAATYGIDRATGAVRWTFKSSRGYTLFSGPAVSGSNVIVSTAYGGAEVDALDAETGALQWSHDFGTNFSSYGSPFATRGSIMIGLANQFEPPCSHGALIALDPASGSTVWEHDTATSSGGAGVWSSANADTLGDVVFTTGNPCLVSAAEPDEIIALTMAGTERWKFQAPEAIAGDLLGGDYDFGSTPVDANGTIVAVSKDGIAYGVDAQLGTLRWEYRVAAESCCPFNGGSISSPAWDGQRLFLGGGSLAGGSDTTGRFVALSSTGSELWAVHATNPVTAPPTVAGDLVFVGLGAIEAALNSKTGATVWSATMPAWIWGGAAIAGNQAVFVSMDGNVSLYALGSAAASAAARRSTGTFTAR